MGGQRESGADSMNPRDKVPFLRLNSLPDVVANRTRRNLRLERDAPIRTLTATPLAFGAVGGAITRRCVSDGRLNQQRRRGEEQKAFHDILPVLLHPS